jgi:hypothetical protein
MVVPVEQCESFPLRGSYQRVIELPRPRPPKSGELAFYQDLGTRAGLPVVVNSQQACVSGRSIASNSPGAEVIRSEMRRRKAMSAAVMTHDGSRLRRNRIEWSDVLSQWLPVNSICGC